MLPLSPANTAGTGIRNLRDLPLNGVNRSRGNSWKRNMTILAIETSCDETAIAIVEAEGDPSKGLGAGETSARFRVLGNALLSQIEIHKEYGGGFPAPAKREHAKNLVPILEAGLEEAELLHEDTQAIPEETPDKIRTNLLRGLRLP